MLDWECCHGNKVFDIFLACHKIFYLFASLYLILTNDSLTIAHLNIEPIWADTSDVILFAESVVFICN